MLIQSERVQKALALSNTLFKRLFGYKKTTFWRILETLQVAYETLHKLGGMGLRQGSVNLPACKFRKIWYNKPQT
jgi:hypothetical protein